MIETQAVWGVGLNQCATRTDTRAVVNEWQQRPLGALALSATVAQGVPGTPLVDYQGHVTGIWTGGTEAIAAPNAAALLAMLEAGSEVPAPKRTRFVSPQYPADAQARGLRGIVILELIIDTEGKVASATVTRSVPPFDDAALLAVNQWEYEVTRVDGKPVPVRLSVPITFTMPVPRVARQEGIPELVQGVNPAIPAGAEQPASAVAEVTLEPSGQITEIEIKSGERAFADALMDALRTWRQP